MDYTAPPNIPYEFVVDFGTSGLVGVIGVRISDNLGNDVVPRTTVGIIEYPIGSAIYATTLTTPGVVGQFSVIWDDGVNFASSDLTVTTDAIVVPVGAAGADTGPCTAWITGADVATCCDVDYGTDSSVFDRAAQEAQSLLFEFSGRLFPGLCSETVRPCRATCRCPWQVLSRGHIVWNWNLGYDPFYGYGWWSNDGDACGCRPLSRVLLSGYVQEITEVVIDGDVVDPATYRVDNNRWLTRVRDPADPDTPLHWPGCQNLDLDEGEDGTWAVTYTFGHNPPLAGASAARELACEIYKACAGQECALPRGTVRLARQGVVMEKTPFASWGYEKGGRGRLQKGWQTGMAMVDLFLNAYNPNGLIRRPVFWSPARIGRFAQRMG